MNGHLETMRTEAPTIRSSRSSRFSKMSVIRPRAQFALIVVCFLISCALNYPGHLNYDTLIQLEEGRSRTYLSIHPPIMSAILGMCDALFRGTGLFFILMNALYFSSFLLVTSGKRFGLLTWFLAPCLFLLPSFLLYQGVLTKDVLFANFALAALTLLYCSNGKRRLSGVFFVLSSICFAVATLARQQGVLVLLGGIMIVFMQEPERNAERDGTHATRIIRTAKLLALVAASLFFMVAGISVTAKQGPVSATDIGLKILEIYDMAGITTQTDEEDFSQLEARGINTDSLKQHFRLNYGADRADPLANPNPARDAVLALPLEEVSRQWVRTIQRFPREYFFHRLNTYVYMLGFGDRDKCNYVHPVGVPSGSIADALVERLGLTPGIPRQIQPLVTSAWLWRNSIFYYPALYLAIGLIVLLTCRRSGDYPLLAALCVSSMLFTLSYFFIGIACDFRYVYYVMVAQVFCLFVSTFSKPIRGQERKAGSPR